MSASSSEDDDTSWQTLLKKHHIFRHLRNSPTIKESRKNVMCEIKGDLFVWSSHDQVLLATNLKKMVAYPEKNDVYQKLLCTRSPETAVVRLLPNPSGEYIALQCEKGVTVITLPWHRGQQGEFGGGTLEVTCSSVPIARDFFTIHQDWPLLQVNWHPTKPFHLVLLTKKDSALRLYSLANPDFEEWSLSLPNSPSAGLSMKDPVVAFVLWRESTFLLQEDSNVTLTPLTPHTLPPPPLITHPQIDDDCGNEAAVLLILQSSPCVVVIATTSGMLSHCVYLSDENETAAIECGPSKECLYIVDSIKFDSDDSDTFPTSLIPDPLYPHTYYVVHSEGVHQVTLPWLLDLEDYSSSDSAFTFPSLLKEKETRVSLLVRTEPGVNWPEGVVVVSEPMLGPTLIALTSDCNCTVSDISPLRRSDSASSEGLHIPRQQWRETRPTGGGFVEVIEKILGSGTYVRTASSHKDATQAQCYKYLASEINRLKQSPILSQRKAKEKIQQKVSALKEQKERLISLKSRLEDEIKDIETDNTVLSQRVTGIQQTCLTLESQLIGLLCRQEAQSPVLSQAEEWMRDELEGFNSHMHVMIQKIIEGRRKFEVCCGPGHTPKVSVSGKQSNTILRTLTESGKSVKNLMEQIHGLKEVAFGPVGS